jgi:hypothetical protein
VLVEGLQGEDEVLKRDYIRRRRVPLLAFCEFLLPALPAALRFAGIFAVGGDWELELMRRLRQNGSDQQRSGTSMFLCTFRRKS